MVALAKPQKKVQVIARVQFKNDTRKVVYFVRSSDGKKEYQTFLFEGHATSCNCPATKPCYHMNQCEAIEAKRTVISVGQAVEVSGVTPTHAVAKALKVVQARHVEATPEDIPFVSPDLPIDDSNVTEECTAYLVAGELAVSSSDEELPELPVQEEEPFSVEFFNEEEFSEELAEVWTEEAIAAIRKAAQYPTEEQCTEAPLNGSHAFSILR